jgi:hypothetical protein
LTWKSRIILQRSRAIALSAQTVVIEEVADHIDDEKKLFWLDGEDRDADGSVYLSLFPRVLPSSSSTLPAAAVASPV